MFMKQDSRRCGNTSAGQPPSLHRWGLKVGSTRVRDQTSLDFRLTPTITQARKDLARTGTLQLDTKHAC